MWEMWDISLTVPLETISPALMFFIFTVKVRETGFGLILQLICEASSLYQHLLLLAHLGRSIVLSVLVHCIFVIFVALQQKQQGPFCVSILGLIIVHGNRAKQNKTMAMKMIKLFMFKI
ncbi:hypothetical protein CRENBAI_022679 [Crenichthys baileyi]|uniref:Uncharacterized protein n=1 Tax=Crenichthys baileyi TaxID=28760 RepID=A0AAV9QZW2_9TELE